jgi:hypothetical protein
MRWAGVRVELGSRLRAYFDFVSMAYDSGDRVTSVTDTRVATSVWGSQTFRYRYHNDRLTMEVTFCEPIFVPSNN